MKTRLTFILGIILVTGLLLGCGMVSTASTLVNGGKGEGTVQNLWPDVPPLDGAKKVDSQLPLTARLAIQAIVKASASSNDVKLDQLNFIAFTTAKTPQDVTAFYTQERMAAAGWNVKDQPGCTGLSSEGGGGGLCIFGKDSAEQSVLFIAMAEDGKTKQTQVFYVRFDGLIKQGSNAASTSATATPASKVTPVAGNIDLSKMNVCKAIPQDEVVKILGRKLEGNPKPFHFDNAQTDSGCEWSAGKDSSKNAYFAYAVIAPVKDYVTNKASATPVAGLGDEAYTTNGADAQQLWVLINGKAAVMVAIGDRPNPDGAKKLIPFLIAQLPH